GVYLFLIKIIIVSICMGTALQVFYSGLTRIIIPGTLIPNLAICILTGFFFLAVFGLAGKLFRIPEIHTLYEKLFRRILPWQPGKK
ncbi:MAG: murein biosynthesis integral membrane protein MurJ, partial [Desulfobacterales bacterium]|nr:murein biosynthesis integral membrane protein MurJ [Desulfobacterales bacterium]